MELLQMTLCVICYHLPLLATIRPEITQNHAPTSFRGSAGILSSKDPVVVSVDAVGL